MMIEGFFFTFFNFMLRVRFFMNIYRRNLIYIKESIGKAVQIMSKTVEMPRVDDSRSLLRYKAPLTHEMMMEYIRIFESRYSCVRVSELGRSVLDRPIPMISLGKGKKSVLYVGAHHGMEWITTAILLKFVNEYCELYCSNGKIGHTSISYLNSVRTLCIVPMLNPDGVDYAIKGLSNDNPIRERVITMNGGSDDLSCWQANARGVDLNHNYDAGFYEYLATDDGKQNAGGSPSKCAGESPESEPESAALANFVRANTNLSLCLSLHSQGEEIYSGDRFGVPKESRRIGDLLSMLSGYRQKRTNGSAAYGGFTDWVVSELGIPSFTLECGKGTNPLPIESLFETYYKLRRLLFEAPMVI